MIASIARPLAPSPDVFDVLAAPAYEAASWVDQPPPVLLALVVLTAMVLMFGSPLPQRKSA